MRRPTWPAGAPPSPRRRAVPRQDLRLPGARALLAVQAGQVALQAQLVRLHPTLHHRVSHGVSGAQLRPRWTRVGRHPPVEALHFPFAAPMVGLPAPAAPAARILRQALDYPVPANRPASPSTRYPRPCRGTTRARRADRQLSDPRASVCSRAWLPLRQVASGRRPYQLVLTLRRAQPIEQHS